MNKTALVKDSRKKDGSLVVHTSKARRDDLLSFAVEPYNIRVRIDPFNEDQRIDALQAKNTLYHATPLHRLERVLSSGLVVSESFCSDNKGRYLCLTEDLGSAITFSYKSIPKSAEARLIVGAVGLDKNRLPKSLKNQLEEDQRFENGIITRASIAPIFFSELILADLEGDNYNLKEMAKAIETAY